MTSPESGRAPTRIDAIAETYLSWSTQNSPILATTIGYPGNPGTLDDFSPQAHAHRYAYRRTALAELLEATPVDNTDRITQDALTRDLTLAIDIYEAGLWRRDLAIIASPAQAIRDVFDLSPTDTITDWEALADRMNAVPDSLHGYTESLRAGITAHDTPARRQVLLVAEQITAQSDFFHRLVTSAQTTDQSSLPTPLVSRLTAAAATATDAFTGFAAFLTTELLPAANAIDAIGRERYQLLSRFHLGADIDLDETYAWGLSELSRITALQETAAHQVLPGATIAEAIQHLNTDPARILEGPASLQQWMQDLSDTAIAALDELFIIPEALKTLECRIAPTNTGGVYYTAPSDDFSRPGRMWWSIPTEVTRFNTWRETTNVYHEGVPGHHLQVGQAVRNRNELNTWRRLACGTAGHAEGWALYAENLMAELGFHNDPGSLLGMLDGQRWRAARVVLDLAIHLGKPRLDGTGIWDFDYARAFLADNLNMSPEFITFETNRYFGWPGQAPSYKVGQRIWEDLRAQAEHLAGDQFDIKAWHHAALNLGGLPLDTLRYALSGQENMLD
jgi:uncharacterized protein (DUF885 family)